VQNFGLLQKAKQQFTLWIRTALNMI
jgi:hypothetical protein